MLVWVFIPLVGKLIDLPRGGLGIGLGEGEGEGEQMPSWNVGNFFFILGFEAIGFNSKKI